MILILAAAVALLSDVSAIDGDTLKAGAEHIRIIGLDAPETGARAQCPAERALGAKATQEARRILAKAAVASIERKGLDKYGRTLANVSIDGQDFAGAMIAAGAARPYKGKRSWCPMGPVQ